MMRGANQYTFNLEWFKVSLAWVGDGTGLNLLSWQVIHKLADFQVPFFASKTRAVKLYRSENYGEIIPGTSFSSTTPSSDQGWHCAIGPENSGKVILTGGVSGGHLALGFLSLMTLEKFHPQDLPSTLMRITHRPDDSKVLVVLTWQCDRGMLELRRNDRL
ncbi:sortilin-like protein [Lates japonicus]|uniref:Sortilin-like protein n=1 Tax=Lates japonicus TaxID=270547 RepID=A0AAD3QVP4_LATJO|nr:sortilin-like protein [Lates japonicus]